MKKLYIVRHYVMAGGIKEATKLSKQREPDDIYIADEFFTKVGMMPKDKDAEVSGFKKR